jgi:hypothetical protein
VKRPWIILMAASLCGCSPALREPPSIAILASTPAPQPVADGSTLLREADLRWAKRPDAAAVAEAESLYLRAAEADEKDTAGLIGAVRAKAWLTDRERNAKRRQELAVSAVQTAQWCQRRQPELAACDYWLALAVGLQAREVRITADDGLKKMVPALQKAIDKDPEYDEAGPHRVMALVLIRAPGWPVGPGDPEAALEHARKAVALRPGFPPNQFALGEAHAALKDGAAARAAYVLGKSLAAGLRDAGDPDAPFWIVEADEALSRLNLNARGRS